MLDEIKTIEIFSWIQIEDDTYPIDCFDVLRNEDVDYAFSLQMRYDFILSSPRAFAYNYKKELDIASEITYKTKAQKYSSIHIEFKNGIHIDFEWDIRADKETILDINNFPISDQRDKKELQNMFDKLRLSNIYFISYMHSIGISNLIYQTFYFKCHDLYNKKITLLEFKSIINKEINDMEDEKAKYKLLSTFKNVE